MTLTEWNASTEEDVIANRNRADELVQKLNIYPPLFPSTSPDDPFIAFRENIIHNNNLSSAIAEMPMKDFAEKIKIGTQKLADSIGIDLSTKLQADTSAPSETDSRSTDKNT